MLKSVGAGVGSGVLLAGRTGGRPPSHAGEGVADIEVNEGTGEPHAIQIRAYEHTRSGERTLHEDTITVEAGGLSHHRNVFEKREGSVSLEYALDGGEPRARNISPVVHNVDRSLVYFSVDPDGLHQSNLHADLPRNPGRR